MNPANGIRFATRRTRGVPIPNQGDCRSPGVPGYLSDTWVVPTSLQGRKLPVSSVLHCGTKSTSSRAGALKGFLNFGVHDRRKNSRLPLQCPLVLWDPEDGSVLRTSTDNISCEGFYCSSPRSFAVGKRLEALLVVPCDGLSGNGTSRNLVLQCQVHVVRIDQKRVLPAFGVAFEIESFIVPATNVQDGLALLA